VGWPAAVILSVVGTPRLLVYMFMTFVAVVTDPAVVGVDSLRAVMISVDTPHPRVGSLWTGIPDRTNPIGGFESRVPGVSGWRWNTCFSSLRSYGASCSVLVPPLQVPDEGDHWFRVALTDGQFTADSRANHPAQASPAWPNLYMRLVEAGLRYPWRAKQDSPAMQTSQQRGTPGYHQRRLSLCGLTVRGYLPQALGRPGDSSGPAAYLLLHGQACEPLRGLGAVSSCHSPRAVRKQLFVLVALLPMNDVRACESHATR